MAWARAAPAGWSSVSASSRPSFAALCPHSAAAAAALFCGTLACKCRPETLRAAEDFLAGMRGPFLPGSPRRWTGLRLQQCQWAGDRRRGHRQEGTVGPGEGAADWRAALGQRLVHPKSFLNSKKLTLAAFPPLSSLLPLLQCFWAWLMAEAEGGQRVSAPAQNSLRGIEKISDRLEGN